MLYISLLLSIYNILFEEKWILLPRITDSILENLETRSFKGYFKTGMMGMKQWQIMKSIITNIRHINFQLQSLCQINIIIESLKIVYPISTRIGCTKAICEYRRNDDKI